MRGEKNPRLSRRNRGVAAATEVSRNFSDFFVAKLAQLGALRGRVVNASLLVVQQYSIGSEFDDLWCVVGVVGVGDEAGLERMLVLAEQAAEQAMFEADIVTDGNSTPILAVALDAARRNRDEPITVQDRFTAFSMFWVATLTARMMVSLARGS